ncbi:MAG: HTH domain-containing protein [Bacillota bacterium]|nr:HTH domain-containing protein [Bacillota bacterium]
MLTRRQRVILSHLLYTNIHIKLQTLADILGITVHTLMGEINRINALLPELDALIIVEKGMCSVSELHKDVAHTLLTNQLPVDTNNTDSDLVWDRINTIMFMLYFEREHISMESLAERFFVSKSTINQAITKIKEITSRREGFVFEVSNTKGLKFHGAEPESRFLLAKLVVQGLDLKTVLFNYYPGLGLDLREIYSEISFVLTQALHNHGIVISGKAFAVICSGFLVCALRNTMGFRLDDSDFQDELHSISVEIRNNLNIQVGLDLEYADIVYMQRILFSYKQSNDSISSEGSELFVTSIILEKTKLLTGINLKDDFNFHSEFVSYVNSLNRRVLKGHDFTNFLKRPINRFMPLAATIIASCQGQLETAGLHYASAELAYLTLMLGEKLEREEEPMNILLVSHEHTAVTNWIVTEISRNLPRRFRIINAVPKHYLEQLHGKDRYLENVDVIITTEALTIDVERETLYVHSLFNQEELTHLLVKLEAFVAQKRAKRIGETIDDVMGEDRFIQIPDEYRGFGQAVDYLLKQLDPTGVGKCEDVLARHFIPNDSKTAYLSVIRENACGTSLIYGRLTRTFRYKGKTYHSILVGSYSKDSIISAVRFSELVRFILEPSHDRRLRACETYGDLLRLFN